MKYYSCLLYVSPQQSKLSKLLARETQLARIQVGQSKEGVERGWSLGVYKSQVGSDRLALCNEQRAGRWFAKASWHIGSFHGV